MPEFVTAIVLIVVFGVVLKWLPVIAHGAAWLGLLHPDQVPAPAGLALVEVLFGYIARMTRAGMIEALGADYTRTA